MILKECKKCKASVIVLNDCQCDGCGITCCGEEMEVVGANTTDAAAEKHVPSCEINGDEITITINHVSEEKHYIEWIAIEEKNNIRLFKFTPGEKPEVTTSFNKDCKVYSYCNLHGLWSTDIREID